MEARKTQTVSLLKQLPLEIRMKIYRNLLSTKYTRHHCTDRQVSATAWSFPIDYLCRSLGIVERTTADSVASMTLVANRCEALAWSCL